MKLKTLWLRTSKSQKLLYFICITTLLRCAELVAVFGSQRATTVFSRPDFFKALLVELVFAAGLWTLISKILNDDELLLKVKIKNVFLAKVGHDLRTPLTSVCGFTELLKSEELSVAERKQYLEILERTGTNLTEFIDNLLVQVDKTTLSSFAVVDSNFMETTVNANTKMPIEEIQRQQMTGINSPHSSHSLERSILVVEDSPDNQLLIRAYLRTEGLKVTVATNGEEGRLKALREQYDLILMDMQMPVKDGYTATKEIRDSGSKVPIVALTAQALGSDQEKCYQAGCTDFLAKPFTRDKLVAIINKHSQTISDDHGRSADVLSN